jgi:hypothetical protein
MKGRNYMYQELEKAYQQRNQLSKLEEAHNSALIYFHYQMDNFLIQEIIMNLKTRNLARTNYHLLQELFAVSPAKVKPYIELNKPLKEYLKEHNLKLCYSKENNMYCIIYKDFDCLYDYEITVL